MIPTEILIEAGEAFGSGAHPSTALSLHWLREIGPSLTGGLLLDVGCGSGILTVSAAKLYSLEVMASDLQAAAVTQTQRNAEANGVAGQVRVIRADGVRDKRIALAAPFSLIFVNILYEVYLPWLSHLRELLAADGQLVLAGLLRWQESALREACAAAGLTVLGQAQEGDWVALLIGRATLSEC